MKAARRPSGRAASESALPPTWLVGRQTRLRPIEPEDVAMLQRWINASPARVWLLSRLPLSEEAERDWAARAATDPQTPTFIIQTQRGKDIGVIGLIVSGARASLGIAIFEPRYWSRGFGSDAVRVLLDGAFRALPLQRIELIVGSDNARAIACYRKAGFVREGVLRRYEYSEGQHCDVVLMSAIHEDWAQRRRPAPSRPRLGRR